MIRILVVDDSWLIRQTVTNILKRENYEVIIGSNGAEGLAKCRAEKPDCMVLDLLMPDMSGLDVVKTLRDEGFTMPVIILTADIQVTTRERCKNAGASDFLIKPPNQEQLIYKIKSLCNHENTLV